MGVDNGMAGVRGTPMHYPINSCAISSPSLSLCIYIYIYIYMCVYVCVCMYVPDALPNQLLCITTIYICIGVYIYIYTSLYIIL